MVLTGDSLFLVAVAGLGGGYLGTFWLDVVVRARSLREVGIVSRIWASFTLSE